MQTACPVMTKVEEGYCLATQLKSMIFLHTVALQIGRRLGFSDEEISNHETDILDQIYRDANQFGIPLNLESDHHVLVKDHLTELHDQLAGHTRIIGYNPDRAQRLADKEGFIDLDYNGLGAVLFAYGITEEPDWYRGVDFMKQLNRFAQPTTSPVPTDIVVTYSNFTGKAHNAGILLEDDGDKRVFFKEKHLPPTTRPLREILDREYEYATFYHVSNSS